MRILLTVILFLLPQALWASCDGTDLRPSLSEAQRATMIGFEKSTPFPNGNHWRASRDDRGIHVIGTMHLPDPRLAPVAERLQPVIAGVEVVFVESTTEDAKDLQERLTGPDSLLLLKDTTLPELMEEAEWQKLAAAVRERGIPPFMAAKMQPWYLSLMLAMPSCALELISGGSGLDARIESLAKAAGVPRRSIEPNDSVFRVFTEEPLEQQLRMLRVGTFPDELSTDILETTLNLYFDEAHSDSWQLSRLMAFAHLDLPADEIEEMLDDMEQKLLIDRNLSWIEVIEDATETRIAVAVGAAHLMGESGLLHQLQLRGYTLERQPF